MYAALGFARHGCMKSCGLLGMDCVRSCGLLGMDVCGPVVY